MKKNRPTLLRQQDGFNIVRVPGKFSNLYLLISSSEIIMIDAGLPSDVRLALEFLDKELHLEPARIKQTFAHKKSQCRYPGEDHQKADAYHEPECPEDPGSRWAFRLGPRLEADDFTIKIMGKDKAGHFRDFYGEPSNLRVLIRPSEELQGRAAGRFP